MNHSRASQKVRFAAFVLVMLAAAAGLAACNTIEGAGKDVERTGEEIQDATE